MGQEWRMRAVHPGPWCPGVAWAGTREAYYPPNHRYHPQPRTLEGCAHVHPFAFWGHWLFLFALHWGLCLHPPQWTLMFEAVNLACAP